MFTDCKTTWKRTGNIESWTCFWLCIKITELSLYVRLTWEVFRALNKSPENTKTQVESDYVTLWALTDDRRVKCGRGLSLKGKRGRSEKSPNGPYIRKSMYGDGERSRLNCARIYTQCLSVWKITCASRKSQFVVNIDGIKEVDAVTVTSLSGFWTCASKPRVRQTGRRHTDCVQRGTGCDDMRTTCQSHSPTMKHTPLYCISL